MTNIPPYKCWGIGLGRTGTTSLCEAFKILGYPRVEHNPPFERLREIDAGADNGVTVYFKYLDYKYPGSKFILTVRNLEDWLSSMEYMTRKCPVSRDQDESIKRRMLLYESVTFDREKFTEGYKRHHENVRRYFHNRPQDLLELNITAGERWEKLCLFLEAPVPAVSFPQLNKQN